MTLHSWEEILTATDQTLDEARAHFGGLAESLSKVIVVARKVEALAIRRDRQGLYDMREEIEQALQDIEAL